MADNRRRFSWTVLAGDGVLLLCALAGFTGAFLSLYGGSGDRRPGATALERCAADGDLLLVYAVIFGLATLAVWSLPRYRDMAAGGMAVLWAGVVLWDRTEVLQGAGVTLRDITALFSRRVDWGRMFFYESGLSSAQEADAVQLFFRLTLAGLALLLGWAVVRSRRWWMVVVLTLPPLLPGLLADLYPDWLPFMALAACWCAMLLTSLCRWAAPDHRGRLTLAVFSAVALVLALITALFPREGYTRPVWARRAENSLINFTSRMAGYSSRWNGPFRNTVTYVGAAGVADLANAGPLNYNGRTVLQVTSDHGGWMYLRGSSLAVYEGGVWEALPDGTYEAYRTEHELEISPLYLPAMQEQNRSPVYTITVENVGAVGACVYTPYFLLPQDVEETGMLPVEDSYLARKQGQWTHTMTYTDRYPRDDPGAYTPGDGSSADHIVYSGGPGPARSAAAEYAGYVYEHYLDVPEDLRELLEGYARFAMAHQVLYSRPGYSYFIDSAQPVQLAELFGAYLDDICRYDASAPAAPDGVDPVYYFLTESQRGYCMHYASAVTLMLRAAGVPARYVSGFAAEVVPDRQTSIPDRAAHAWVEVWIGGFGWYPVEVTPDDAFDWARQPGVADPDDPLAGTPEPTPEPTETPEPSDAPGEPTDPVPGSGDDLDGPEQGGPGFMAPHGVFAALISVFIRAVCIVAAALLAWSVQYAVKRFRVRRMAGADANRSALMCYGYLSRMERWGGKIDPQAVELAQKARFSQHTLTQEELSFLRDLVDRERTRLCVAPGLPKRLVCRYWWGMPREPGPLTDRTLPKQEE